MIASEYGWTVPQIMDCTARQISFCMRQIGHRRQVNLCIEAALHGIKMDMPKTQQAIEAVKMTPEQEAMADMAMKSAMKRHQEERRG